MADGDTDRADVASEGIAAAEYRQRLHNVRAAAARAGLGGIIAFGDCWRSANISYFTEFRPLDGVSDIANAIVSLPVDDEASRFVSEQCLGYAASVTTFPVAPLQDLPPILRRGYRSRKAKVGLAGLNYIPVHLFERITASLPDVTLAPTTVLADLKAIKSPAEIALIRKAASLTDAAMAAIRDTLADGRLHSERELARIADVAMLAGGAERPAYDSMVQAGDRSAYNLARPTDRLVRPGDLVMTDIGARYRGYVADGGRGFTYGSVDRVKREIVDAAASAVEAGMALAAPGMKAAELNAAIQRALVALGYEKHSGEARGHGTGHGTGMDPEEESPWIGPGNQTMLVENMVFTLKATITVPGVGGLRTERIVLLTSAGCEPLDAFPMRLHW